MLQSNLRSFLTCITPMALAFLLMACGSATPDATMTPLSITTSPVEIETPISDTDMSPSSEPSLTNTQTIMFPQQQASTEPQAFPAAAVEGILILENQCIRLQPMQSDISYLLLWPSNFTIESTDMIVHIRDENGVMWGSIGDRLVVSGGEIAEQLAQAHIGSQLAQQCIGPYWLVSP